MRSILHRESKFGDGVLLALIWCCLLLLFEPLYWGDTPDYAFSIQEKYFGRDSSFYEFGHLLWRPLGYTAYLSAQIISPLAEFSPLRAIRLLVVISMICGFAALIIFYLLLRRYGVSRIVGLIGATLFGLYPPFLNYAQAAVPYVPGLTFLLLAIYIGIAPGFRKITRLIGQSVALMISVGLWTPYILCLPAIALLSSSRNENRLQYFIQLTVSTTLLLALCFLFGSALGGAKDVSSFLNWIEASQHGKTDHGGVLRVVFGIPNSFLEMSELGKAAKAILLSGNLSSSALANFPHLELFFFTLIYGLLAVVFCAFVRNRRVTPMGWLSVGALVGFNLAFAYYFDGSSLERYLAFGPLLIFATMILWAEGDRRQRVVVMAIAVVVLMGSQQYYAPRVEQAERAVLNRLPSSVREGRDPQSILIVLNTNDPLNNLRKGFIYNPSSGLINNSMHVLVRVGTIEAVDWGDDLAQVLKKAVEEERTIWVVEDLFEQKPPARTGWIEGEDPRVTWPSVRDRFLHLAHSCATERSGEFVGLKCRPEVITE